MTKIKGRYAEAEAFAGRIEDYAVAQVRQLCDQKSFEGCKIRIMPDVHPGKVGPVGFTSTLGRTVMPEVVGSDIGCGMTMTELKTKGGMEFKKLDAVIRDNVPSGSGSRKTPHRFADGFDFERLRCLRHVDVERAKKSIGTLGGGNHFIEMDVDDNGGHYLIIHTGSHHLGKEVTEHYLREGKKALKDAGLEVPYELTWIEGSLMENYLADMEVVREFAEENREAILDSITKGMKWKTLNVVSCVHNYVDFSGGEPMIRKGAVSAKKGEAVVIPMNMRDGVIVGRGLGNEGWNCSAPHGAGRLISREKARTSHTVSEFKKAMEGIYSTSITAGTLDEAPFAYRGIDEILPLLKETVSVEKLLKPVYNFKAQGEVAR